MSGFGSRLREVAERVAATMEEIVPVPRGPEATLIEAMRGACLAGGKRLRPFLAVESGRLFEAPEQALFRAAAALECIHAYSLIHDDLPCMDDDDTRRGRPSTHKEFGEATAVLAGDGLLTLAFGVLASRDTHPDHKLRCNLVAAAAHHAGITGMIGGQIIDIAVAEKGTVDESDLPLLTRMMRMKTGSLFALAVEFGAILGHAGDHERHALTGFTHDLGLAYQIADDIRDGEMGIAGVLGVGAARERLHLLSGQARQHLAPFGARAEHLLGLIDFVAGRQEG